MKYCNVCLPGFRVVANTFNPDIMNPENLEGQVIIEPCPCVCDAAMKSGAK